MSSHREAPAISKDPVADSTDVYAFVSPDAPETVTILANYIPLQDPAAGPNFFEFGEDVLYEIHIDNTGSGVPSITFQFNFTTTIRDPTTFLYNTGQINSLDDPNWNRPQTYTITRVQNGVSTNLTPAGGLFCPPCNVGVRSIPNYPALATAATYSLDLAEAGTKVFAGQRSEGFFVDLGSIFDLGDLRPLSPDHELPGTAMAGINSLANKNVHTIALQLPITSLTSDGLPPTGPTDPRAVIGVYTTASRSPVRMFNPQTGVTTGSGAPVQVSRLGNPLVNEVVVPMASKDFFNSQPPVDDKQFAAAVEFPYIQTLLTEIYPTAFPNLKAFIGSKKPRLDLVAIFVTGIPAGVVAGFDGNYQGGKVIAEMLRMNMLIAPTGTNGAGTSNLGLLGGDIAGFPNGRRPTDDVVTIELKAVAGATIALVYPTYKADGAVKLVTDDAPTKTQAFQSGFPYLANPLSGFYNPPETPVFSYQTTY
jgi:hypothetical protein